MKLSNKSFAIAAVSVAAVGAFATATPAIAAAPQPLVYTASSSATPPAELIGPNGEKPTQWGVAAVPVGSSRGAFAPTASKSVGGGTWNYGTRAAALGTTCYSNYIHPTKKHSATAIKAGHTSKVIREADIWANASITAGAAYTCYTYWGVY
ncbi:lactococcin 972 family bacteriocin [Streptomyces sp. NPDC054932]